MCKPNKPNDSIVLLILTGKSSFFLLYFLVTPIKTANRIDFSTLTPQSHVLFHLWFTIWNIPKMTWSMNEFNSHKDRSDVYISPLHSRRAFPDNFSFLKFLLAHSCFTMLCSFLQKRSDSATRTHTCPLGFRFPSPSGPHRARSGVPRALQQASLVTHFIHVPVVRGAELLSLVRLFVTPETVARQAPLSMGFFRQEYWSGLPFLPPGIFPTQGLEPESPVSPALVGGFFTRCATGEALSIVYTGQAQYWRKKTEGCAKPRLLKSAL